MMATAYILPPGGAARPRATSKGVRTSSQRRSPRKREAETVRHGGFDDAHRRHFKAARPPRPGCNQRLRRTDGEMRDGADDERGDDGRHADREKKRDDWN